MMNSMVKMDKIKRVVWLLVMAFAAGSSPLFARIEVTPADGECFAIGEDVILDASGVPDSSPTKECKDCNEGTWQPAESVCLFDGGNKLDTSSPGEKSVTCTAKYTWICSETGDDEKDDETETFTYKVVKVEFDYVDGADEIGSQGGEKIYATAQGGGNITVNLKATPDDVQLPANFVNWSGGSEASNQLNRTLSKSSLNESGENISAKVNNDNILQSKIYVFKGKPAKTDLEIDIDINYNNNACQEPFGNTDYNDAIWKDTNKYDIYYENKKWKFIYAKVSYEIRYGVKSGIAANVVSGDMNPFPNGCLDVNTSQTDRKKIAKVDLTPDATGRCIRLFYWSYALSTKHELFHANDWKNNYHIPIVKTLSQIIKADEVDVTILNLEPKKVMEVQEIKFEKLYINMTISANDIYDILAERDAYLDGKSDYQKLADSIIP